MITTTIIRETIEALALISFTLIGTAAVLFS
jgi:hypothetical protein